MTKQPPTPPVLDARGLPPPQSQSLEDEKTIPFWIFLIISVCVFAAGTLLGVFLKPAESTKVIDVSLEYLEGVQNEPPPLGAPDAGGPAAPESPPPEPPKPPEPVSPPEQPPPLPEPVPRPQPEFPKPEEKPSATPAPPTPRPRASTPKPAGLPAPVVPRPKTTPGGIGTGATDNPNPRPGPRGVAGGVPGGKGGQAGKVIARPKVPYDNMMYVRRYEGSGMVSVMVSAGRVVDVQITKSTGISYLDAKARAWIRGNWKFAPDASGKFDLPIIFKLNH
jgi:TonB family protein